MLQVVRLLPCRPTKQILLPFSIKRGSMRRKILIFKSVSQSKSKKMFFQLQASAMGGIEMHKMCLVYVCVEAQQPKCFGMYFFQSPPRWAKCEAIWIAFSLSVPCTFNLGKRSITHLAIESLLPPILTSPLRIPFLTLLLIVVKWCSNPCYRTLHFMSSTSVQDCAKLDRTGPNRKHQFVIYAIKTQKYACDFATVNLQLLRKFKEESTSAISM